MKRLPMAAVLAGLALVTGVALLPARDESQPSSGSVSSLVAKKRASFLNVLDASARGDGQADDTSAIQALIDSGAGTIRFPPGIYRLTRPLEIDLDRVGPVALVADGTARLVMAGPGPALRFRGTHAGTADPQTVQPNVWERQRMPVVQGLAIVGAHPEADGIEAAGTMQLTLRGVHIRRCRHGVHLVERNRNFLMEGCHIYENSGCGVFYDQVNLHQSNIAACHISYCRGGGIVVRGGEVRNIHIAGCDIEGNMAADGPPTANILLDCAEGSVAEVAITGCTIQHTRSGPDSANIRILGRGYMQRRGQRMEFQCGHVTIGDNVLSDVQTNIHLVGARGVTIVGNTLWQGYSHNLLLEDCQQVVIGPNMLERNPLYSYTDEAANRVVLRRCRDSTLSGLHVHHVLESEAGLLLEGCRRVHITGCTILDCAPVGLLLRDCEAVYSHGNLIRDDRPDGGSMPVQVVGGQDNTVAP